VNYEVSSFFLAEMISRGSTSWFSEDLMNMWSFGDDAAKMEYFPIVDPKHAVSFFEREGVDGSK